MDNDNFQHKVAFNDANRRKKLERIWASGNLVTFKKLLIANNKGPFLFLSLSEDTMFQRVNIMSPEGNVENVFLAIIEPWVFQVNDG